MDRQQMIEDIKEVIKPTRIGIPGHSVCSHELLMIGDVLDWIPRYKYYDYYCHSCKYSGNGKAVLHKCLNPDMIIGNGEYDGEGAVYKYILERLLSLRINKRSDIDRQPDTCVSFVYSLLESDNSLCKSEDK